MKNPLSQRGINVLLGFLLALLFVTTIMLCTMKHPVVKPHDFKIKGGIKHIEAYGTRSFVLLETFQTGRFK